MLILFLIAVLRLIISLFGAIFLYDGFRRGLVPESERPLRYTASN